MEIGGLEAASMKIIMKMCISVGDSEAGWVFRVLLKACSRNEVSSASITAVLKYFTMVDQRNQS